ncbi:hypothetical protein T4B_11259 [Trichinella pseudospiralis]|uniref:Uncharacterized protein n=1 Tax=Trichinella pseudospiralis TaxID=6337 RepID=A0A0V1GBW4_TRIPS|nr:hypothetical protein T4B_11259 [Trichinella pseudospiralis]
MVFAAHYFYNNRNISVSTTCKQNSFSDVQQCSYNTWKD